MNSVDALTNWLPLRLAAKDGEPFVEWAYMGEGRLTEPFFYETAQNLMDRPFNLVFRQQTSLSVLVERAKTQPGLPLNGLVFHMSRCGSTLTAQALAALDDSVVLSEPEPLGTLMQWLNAADNLDAHSETVLLKALLAALGQPRRNQDSKLFLKTECWQILHINKILAAFPGVPWIFLYRDPVEVMVSQMNAPMLYLMPGAMASHGLLTPETLMQAFEETAARVLGNLMEAAAQALNQHPQGLLVNYSQLPAAITDSIARHFDLNLNDAQLTALQTVCRRNAKFPSQVFQADSAEKQASADVGIRAVAASYLDAPYAELERLRMKQMSG